MKFLGGNADQFRIDSGGGSFTLAPGVSRQVVVSFVPTSGGSKKSHLKFYSDDPDENPIWAELKGRSPDTEPPVISYCYPAANSQNVPKNTKIQFELKDSEIASNEITIAGVDEVPDLPDNVKGVGLKYHFGPDGLQFNNTVTIRIPFAPEDMVLAGVKNPLELEIYYYHTSTGEWVQLEIVDANDQYLYVEVDQFCYLNIAKSEITGVDQNQQQSGPEDMLLEQNYPNPFNPETHIGFQVPATGHIQIEIYNSTGQKIRTLVDETMSAGRYDVVWDGRDDYGKTVSSGMYFYAMRSESFKQIRRMVFTK